MSLNDPAIVAAEYADEQGLLGRRNAYRYASGPDARKRAVEAVLEVRPRRVLEVGCGPGEASEQIAAGGAEVVAVDISPRMVELARERGVDARLGDVQELPFDDASFDCALAAWMLYHVPDPERAVAELARVVAGRLVVVTNRADHLHELRELLGSARESPFDDRNAPDLLAGYFAAVEEEDLGGWIDFPDGEAVRAYVKASRGLWQRDVSDVFDEPLRVRRSPVLYIATR